jgi:hypothetical protein
MPRLPVVTKFPAPTGSFLRASPGAISLLGAWMLVRVPRSQPLVAITTLAVVAALFGLGGSAFHDMYQFPFGSQLVVMLGPGGTVELEPVHWCTPKIAGMVVRSGRSCGLVSQTARR